MYIPNSYSENSCMLEILGNFSQGCLFIVDMTVREEEDVSSGTLWFQKVVRVQRSAKFSISLSSL